MAEPRYVIFAVISSFVLAELGDKTMLATVALASDHNWAGVWIGATVGMVLADGVAIAVGRAAAQAAARAASCTAWPACCSCCSACGCCSTTRSAGRGWRSASTALVAVGGRRGSAVGIVRTAAATSHNATRRAIRRPKPLP